MENLYEKLEEAAKMEEKYADELDSLADSIKHTILKSLLKAVAQDSRKHAMFYRAAARIVRGAAEALTPEEYEAIKKTIDKHIRSEEEMIKMSAELLKSTKDPRLAIIYDAILRDEERHHTLLISIKEAIARIETLSDEDFWREVWKESIQFSRHKAIGPRAE